MYTPLQPPAAAHRVSRRQRGVTLIEALVALLVMSFGMLALVGLMSNLRRSADLAKQRGEAMRIARAELTKLRNFSELAPSATTPATASVYSLIATSTIPPFTPPDSNTSYGVDFRVTPLTDAQAKQVRVRVTWTDRTGADQFVELHTIIASVDPLFSAAVGFTPPTAAVTQPSGRHPAIPAAAKQLDPSISVFRPSSLSDTVWIFNNLTGVITGKCSIDPATALTTLTVADIDACQNPTVGYLLSGVIRFSNTSPPNPTLPEANALPHLDLSFVDGSYSLPQLDPRTGMPVTSGGNMVLDPYTATAPAGSSRPDCFNDSPGSSPNSQPFVTYYCIVYPPDPGAAGTRATWSGQVILTGLTTGTSSSEYRVCRYSADYNGNGSSFTADWKALENAEHPAVYAKVANSLTRQNFLVVRGDQNCPTAPAVDPSAGVFADYTTLQLQPSP